MAHLAKMIAHAEREFRPARVTPTGHLTAQLPLYKRFLKIENHRLRLAHQAGGGGREICQRRVRLLDVFLQHLFSDACRACLPEKNPAAFTPAMVAIGGYGRGELNPFSDVDIMFLHNFRADKAPGPLQELIKQTLYVLWDIGFKVGHATRSITDACAHANEENISKTALLEARFLAGREELLTNFKARFDRLCVQGKEKPYLAWRREDQRVRHLKFGPAIFLQEPNVKSSPGGLRDYHNLLWSAFFRERATHVDQLTERKFINDSERRALEKAYDFILRVRTDLHYLAKRPADTLAMNFQSQIADRFQYPANNSMRRTEAFMREYYQHARTISLTTETLFERLLESRGTARPKKPIALLRFFTRPGPGHQRFDGFVTHGGQIYPETREVFNQDPIRLIRVFGHAQTRDLRISSELAQLIRRRLRLVNRTFQYARAAREAFGEILSRKGQVGRILRAMHEVDLLGAYLPEFGDLTCLVQHEFFHRYSADEHTLVCIEKLDALADPALEPFSGYRELFEKVEDPCVLYLALLLHDTGKASSAKHHAEASALFAQKVAVRLQLSTERRRSLILLVDHHMTMSSTAQRRNLDDPDTIIEFAQIVKDRPTLDALMLLTFADGQGVSDKAWSDWKESLVWQLYRSTRDFLAEGETTYLRNRRQREKQRKAVAAALDASYPDELDAHFQYMPDRYFETFQAPAIADHLRLVRQFLAYSHEHDTVEAGLSAAIQWKPQPDRGHTECWVCTWERKGLLAKLAGSFSAAGLNILSADIFTREDSIVLDMFRVSTAQNGAVVEPRDLAAVEGTLRSSLLTETYDFQALLLKARKRRRGSAPVLQEMGFPTRTVITNEATSRQTLLEVQTPDRLGLLYDLLRALGKLGVNVVLARIATEMGAAFDSFYLTGAENERITDSATIKKIEEVIQSAAPRSKSATHEDY